MVARYTDFDETQQEGIEKILPKETFQEFRSSYVETAKHLREIQQKEGEDAPDDIQQLDFEFVLFASAVIDYDYIMSLIVDRTQQRPSKQKMTKAQVINLLNSKSNLMDVEDFTDLLALLELSWKERRTKERAFMEDLIPLQKK